MFYKMSVVPCMAKRLADPSLKVCTLWLCPTLAPEHVPGQAAVLIFHK